MSDAATASPPAVATCPVHALASTGSCSRCGRFVCATCARTLQERLWCEACEPAPIGGWLLVAMLVLGVRDH